ncbi:MAG: hypothetical protein D6790_18000 [Caldilineae bacterium]|nr:MAG: hypothetical protein D6790_18000 [Caldilineae bacterium]
MEKLQESHPVEIVWHAFELRPRNGPPISPAYRAQIEAGRPRVYQIAQEQYGLTMNPGPFGIDSRPALIGVKYAESQGCGAAFHRAVLHAYWQEAAVIDDLDVLTEIAAQVGLEREAFRAALADPTFEEQVDADIALAQAYGLNGVPALVFDNKYLIPGALPYEALRQAVDQIHSQEEAT